MNGGACLGKALSTCITLSLHRPGSSIEHRAWQVFILIVALAPADHFIAVQWLSTAQDLNWRMLLEPPSLTPSGRPVLTSGEVERCLLDKVNLWPITCSTQRMHLCASLSAEHQYLPAAQIKPMSTTATTLQGHVVCLHAH